MLYALRGGVVGLQLFSALLLARLMGVAEFGVYAVLWAATLITATLISIGGPNFLLKAVPARRTNGIKEEPFFRTLWIVFIGPCLAAVLGFLAYTYIAPYLPQDRLPPEKFLWLILGSALAYNFMQCLVVYVREEVSDNWGMLVQDIMPHMFFIITALVLFFQQSLSAQRLFEIFFYLMLALGLCLILGLTAFRKLRLGLKVSPYEGGQTSFWYYAVFGALSSQLDVVLAGALFSPQVVGIYTIVKRMANFTAFPGIVAYWAISRTLSGTFAVGDMAGLRNQIRLGAKLVFLPAIAIGAIIFLSHPLWAKAFDVPDTPLLIPLTLALVAGNLVSAFFNVTVLAAHQCGYIVQGLYSRVFAVFLLFSLTVAVAFTGWITPIALAVFWATHVLAFNMILWYVLKRGIKVDTSILSLFSKTHDKASL